MVDSADQSGVHGLVKVAVSLEDILTFLLLNSFALPLIDIITHLLGDRQGVLLGMLRALLGDDIRADLGVLSPLVHIVVGRGGVVTLSASSVQAML